MNDERRHLSVMLEESTEFLAIKPDGVYVDCTFGSGGHSAKILSHLSQKGRLVAFDFDSTVKKKWLDDFSADSRFTLIIDNFSNLRFHLQNLEITKVDGFIFDLGLSSMQLETGRGFSYRDDHSLLDMRMDNSLSLTAQKIISSYSEEKLSNLFFNFGEIRKSRRLAAKIIKLRKQQEINTVAKLVSLITSSLGKNIGGSHPAKKVFQALRIEVNDELINLKNGLSNSLQFLNQDGRVLVISYHSLEDRIVKNFYKEVTSSNQNLSLLNKKVIVPSSTEILFNRKSRSAKLRILVSK